MVGVFPSALHTAITGPGSRGGGPAKAGVPPLGLGQQGVGESGRGAGSGQSGTPGSGAGAAHGTGPGAGSGAGRGSGSGPTSSPTRVTGPPPPGPGCAGGQPCPTSPQLSIKCHDGVPGDPNSHTTDDPLSPPCVTWDLRPGNDDPSHGVYSDHIDVVVLGFATLPPFRCRDVPPPSQPGAIDGAARTWRALCHYFQTTFQTYGREINLYWYNVSKSEGASPQLLADDLHKGLYKPGNANPPFAVLQDSGGSEAGERPNSFLAKDQIEYFEAMLVDAGGYYGNNGYGQHYFDAFLKSDWSQGGSLNGGVPYFWSFHPSVEEVLREGEAWVCQSLAGKPAANSDDPNLRGTPRKLALAYDTGGFGPYQTGTTTFQQYRDSLRDLADRFATATNLLCGRQVFDQFGSDPLTGRAQQALWVDGAVYPNPQPSAQALACMQHSQVNPVCPNNVLSLQPDTSVLCLLCKEITGLAGAEPQAHYFPEFIFVSGPVADAFNFRLGTQFIYGTPAGFSKAFGITELWQLPGFTAAYWERAYSSVSPTTVMDPFSGMGTYETLMQVLSALQLAGPSPSPTRAASGDPGRDSSYVGLYGWQRRFTYDASLGNSSAPLSPPASPAAGYSPGDYTFVRGMIEQRWDPTGVPAGGPYPSELMAGCFRIINNSQRFAFTADRAHHLDGWGSGSYDETQGIPPAATPLPPCTGDSWGQGT